MEASHVYASSEIWQDLDPVPQIYERYPTFRRVAGYGFLVWFCLLGLNATAFASPNATIINGNVQLRESYPTFGASTLFKFQLTAGPILAIIREGSRVEVLRKKIVANTQEWLETSYTADTKTLKGWVYAGEVGHRKYISLDSGVENELPVAGRSGEANRSKIFVDSMASLLFRTARAQAAVEPPPVPTDPLRTLLFSLAYVVIFIGSLFVIKKWIFRSNIYAFLASLSVLLILGFLSETTLAPIIAKVLTG